MDLEFSNKQFQKITDWLESHGYDVTGAAEDMRIKRGYNFNKSDEELTAEFNKKNGDPEELKRLLELKQKMFDQQKYFKENILIDISRDPDYPGSLDDFVRMYDIELKPAHIPNSERASRLE